MSQDANHKVSVTLLDKEYLVGCPDGAEAELFASVDYLDRKMREIRQSGKVLGVERIAVMAALNISHELMLNKQLQREQIEQRIQKLGEKIDRSMARLDEPVAEPQPGNDADKS